MTNIVAIQQAGGAADAGGASETAVDHTQHPCGTDDDDDGVESASPIMPTLPLALKEMPLIGYGVGTAWFRSSGVRVQALKDGVIAALDAGFRHLDEAEMYCNEEHTGEALQQWLAKTSTPRSELWVTSKVLSVDDPGGIAAVCDRSLQALGVGYFDLYLIHAPCQRDGMPFKRPLREYWAQMEALVDAGKARRIGVSNWRVADLEQLEGARLPPVCNQLEANPHLQQPKLQQYCAAHGIGVAAYAPLAPLTKDCFAGGAAAEAAAAVAARLGLTPAQVLLRWSLDTGRVPITTTSRPERLKDFLAVPQLPPLAAADADAISVAGAAAPRRTFWLQCTGHFKEDPREEPDT